jgi:hypothetical protein
VTQALATMRAFESHCSQELAVMAALLPCLETVFAIFEVAPSRTKEIVWQFFVFAELHTLSAGYCCRIAKVLVAADAGVAPSVRRSIFPCMPVDLRFWVGKVELEEAAECLFVVGEYNEQIGVVQQALRLAEMHSDREQLVEVVPGSI